MQVNVGLLGQKIFNAYWEMNGSYCVGCVRSKLSEDDVSLRDLHSRLSLQPLESRSRINRLRWYGHVERSEDWIKRCTQIDVSGCQGRGRPRKSWKESVTDDLRLWNIAPNMVHDRSKWKNALKTVMKSPTPGNRGKVAQSGKVSTSKNDRFSSWNLLLVNVQYYQNASQQVMSCEPTSFEPIPLWVVRQQGCEMWANEQASYHDKSLQGRKLT